MMKNILLIDDDPELRQLTSQLLSHEGYRVVEAENGKRALELVVQRPPDLVLCDVKMPEMDGFGVLHELGRNPRTADIPFIFISGKVERADVRRGMDQGADDYLTKPFQASELLDAVEGRLKRSEMFRRPFAEGVEGLDQFLDLARGLEVLKDLGKHHEPSLLVEQEPLYRQGDMLDHVTYIASGKIRTFNVNRDGKELTLGLHGPGDFIGFFSVLDKGIAKETAEALEPSKVVRIPKEELFALLFRDHDVSACFIKMLSHDVEDMKGRMLQLAYASIRQRVAQSLLRIHDRFAIENDPSLGVRITREDLASVVGTATESLIRSLSDLKEERLISVNGRDIRILNKPGLEKLAHL